MPERRSWWTLFVTALVVPIPLAAADASADGEPELRASASTGCGGKLAPRDTTCTTTFKVGSGVTIEVSECYTGQLTIKIRDTKITAYPKITRDVTLEVVCGLILRSSQTGALYANREAAATVTTGSIYDLVRVGGQDPGLGPWFVTFHF